MVNVSIVGCGYWGPKHIRVFHELPEANLTSVCDLEQRTLDQIHRLYPSVATTQDFGKVVRDGVDAVVIATPVASHYKLAKEALLHDKHVLIEKPIALNSEQTSELIELAENRKRVLMVGHTYEYNPAVEFLTEIVKSGDLGEIYYIDAARLSLGLFRPDVDVIWDLAPHDICIARALAGQEPVAVSAQGAAHINPATCDVAYLQLFFPSGLSAHIHVSWLDPRRVREITIAGSRKMAVYDDTSDSEKVRIYDKGVTVKSNNDGFSAWPPQYRYGDVTIPFLANAEPLKLECRHFLQCILEGKRPRSDGSSGLKIVNILEAASQSLRRGGQRVAIALPSNKKQPMSLQLAESATR